MHIDLEENQCLRLPTKLMQSVLLMACLSQSLIDWNLGLGGAAPLGCIQYPGTQVKPAIPIWLVVGGDTPLTGTHWHVAGLTDAYIAALYWSLLFVSNRILCGNIYQLNHLYLLIVCRVGYLAGKNAKSLKEKQP